MVEKTGTLRKSFGVKYLELSWRAGFALKPYIPTTYDHLTKIQDRLE